MFRTTRAPELIATDTAEFGQYGLAVGTCIDVRVGRVQRKPSGLHREPGTIDSSCFPPSSQRKAVALKPRAKASSSSAASSNAATSTFNALSGLFFLRKSAYCGPGRIVSEEYRIPSPDTRGATYGSGGVVSERLSAEKFGKLVGGHDVNAPKNLGQGTITTVALRNPCARLRLSPDHPLKMSVNCPSSTQPRPAVSIFKCPSLARCRYAVKGSITPELGKTSALTTQSHRRNS